MEVKAQQIVIFFSYLIVLPPYKVEDKCGACFVVVVS